LTEDEIAFYDALEVNDSAVKVLGDETLKGIARELVETVRRNVTIDWTVRENVRAKLRVYVKRILKKHGYPPDKQEKPHSLSSNRLRSSRLIGFKVVWYYIFPFLNVTDVRLLNLPFSVIPLVILNSPALMCRL